MSPIPQAPRCEDAKAEDAGAPADQAPSFESFFVTSLDLLAIRDSDFKIVKVNQAWTTTLGYELEELEGQPMLSFIHPDDIAVSRLEMERAETGQDVWRFTNRYRCKNGGYRYFEWRAHHEGQLVYGVGRDVTERIALEAAMEQARAEAEAANAAKSEFLANMSHEIRTPLNGVIGVAAALAQTELSQQQRDMVELILTSGHTLERVVSDVLDLSKIEAGKLEFEMQPFDLRPEADGLLEIFRLRAEEKGLAFSVNIGPGGHGWLRGDIVRIKQVLGNLVSNAIKFTTSGEVSVSIDVREPRDGSSAVLEFEIQDTGIGFDEAFSRKLFQRFSQADGSITRQFGGTGLGLSICNALVETMGGAIRATSEPGRGTHFRVTIPVVRQSAPVSRREPPAPASIGQRLQGDAASDDIVRILLAEDHAINRRVVELILAPAGATLTMVENGAEAVRAYKAENYALVLMDMQMPVMDGLAATRAIRAFEAEAPGRPRTPIIMLSANAMRQHKEDAITAGADLHLAKPVTAASLLGAVARALDASGESDPACAPDPDAG